MRKKPKVSYKMISVRVTVEEYDAVQKTAYDKGMYMSPWLQDLAVKAAKRAGNL